MRGAFFVSHKDGKNAQNKGMNILAFKKGNTPVKKTAVLFADFVSLALGALVYAAGFTMFLLPGEILLGGATGLSTVLRILFGTPVGLVTALVNLPLLLIGLFTEGKRGVLRAALGVLSLSLALDLFAWLPPLTEERLIAAVLGGIITGGGSAIQLSRGFTSGGSDLAAYLIRRRLPRLSMGLLVSFIDGVIVLLSAFVLRDAEGLLFATLAIAAYSFSLDFFLSYAERTRLALVICPREHQTALAREIGSSVGRGVTLLSAEGGYTGEGKSLLLCAMHAREESTLRLAVRKTAPGAFLILLSAPAVFGHRFREEELDKPPVL